MHKTDDAAASGTVAMIVPCFPKLSETFVVNKFLGLLDAGWDAHIICNESDPDEWDRSAVLKARPELKRRVHVGWPQRPRARAVLLVPAALVSCFMRSPKTTWRYLRRGIASDGADIFRRLYLDRELIVLSPELAHFEFGPLAVGRMRIKELLDCKTIVSLRGYDINYVGLEDESYYSEVWEKADALHLLGEDLWRRAQSRGCPSNKLRALIAPAINPETFLPAQRQHDDAAGTTDRPLRILSVGRLEWKKGYDYALEAARRLQAAGVRYQYRIVGDGDYLEAISFAIHQLKLDGVELLGPQPQHEVKQQMLWADVFLHSAVSEGFCNSVMEAAAMMLPVVCSDADGLSENVADGETGFVVSRRAPAALSEKLIRLARDPRLRQRMGEAGRERVKQRFRLSDQIDAFDNLYRLVLSSAAAPAHLAQKRLAHLSESEMS